MLTKISTLSALLAVVLSSGASAWEFSGKLKSDTRYYFNDGLYTDKGMQSAFGVELSTKQNFFDDQLNFEANFLARGDDKDSNASYFDPNTLKLAYYSDNSIYSIGYNVVFWGVAESVNIVNILNQTNYVEDLTGDQKFGQPMVSWFYEGDFGNLELYGLFFHKEREYATESGRLGLPFPVEKTLYDKKNADEDIDFAARWKKLFGDFDIALSYFSGTNRVPTFTVDPISLTGAQPNVSLIARYDELAQFGVEIQYISGSHIYKLESIAASDSYGHYFAAVAGTEYTFVGILDSLADLSVYLEYLYDDRKEQASSGIYTNDILLATKLYLNDEHSTAIQSSVIFDHLNDETVWAIELERRINSALSINAEFRVFDTGPSLAQEPFTRLGQLATITNTNLHHFLNNEDFFKLEINYYF